MGSYVGKRFAQAALVLFLVVTVVFFLGRVVGDPVALFAGQDVTVQDLEKVRHDLGLDKPAAAQYRDYVSGLFTGNLGASLLVRGYSVSELLWPALLNSMKLAVTAMLFALGIGLPLGISAALNRGTAIDLLARIVAAFGLVAPGWWLGIISIILFSIVWSVLPPSGMGGYQHYILPAGVLGLHAIAGIARLTRSSMLEVLDSEFIKLAKAKGMPHRVVVWKHAFRNALIPLVTYAGLYFALLVTGAVAVEVVFSWPGMGRLMWESLGRRDYPVLQGAVLTAAVVIVGFNLVIDILYGVIDPRIRISHG